MSAGTFSAFPRFMQLPDQHDGQGDDEDGEYPDPADAQQELPVRNLPILSMKQLFVQSATTAKL